MKSTLFTLACLGLSEGTKVSKHSKLAQKLKMAEAEASTANDGGILIPLYKWP